MGGGGPMEGGGPCGRCNQDRAAQDDFRRERIDPFAQNAPFPGENNNLNQDINGNLIGNGENLVQDENILGANNGGQRPLEGLPGLQAPAQPGGSFNPAVEAPELETEEEDKPANTPGAESHTRETASSKKSTH